MIVSKLTVILKQVLMSVNLFLRLIYRIEDINSHLTRIFLATRDDTFHLDRLCTVKATVLLYCTVSYTITTVYVCVSY